MVSLEKIVKEKDSAMKEALKENKCIKTNIANMKKELKTSLVKTKENDTSIKDVVKANKTINTKVTKVEEEIKKKVDRTTPGDGMSIEEEHELLKLKVFHLENELKKAVEKIVDLIKGIKEENIKRKKEIMSLNTK